MSLAERYTAWLEKYKLFVILFWVAAVCACLYFAPRLIDKTTYTFDPPPQSKAQKGNEALQKAFPQNANGSTNLAIFIFTTDDSPILREDVASFSYSINKSVYDYRPSDPHFVQQCMGYYTAMAMQLSPVATKYLSTKNTSTIISISGGAAYSSALALDFSKYLSDSAAAAWHPQTNNIKYEVLGTSAFLPMLQQSAERDFLFVDGISLPLALFVLAYILRSLRLMMIPVLCIGTSIVVTFGLMYIVASFLDVVAFTPSLMMSILVAMSFDYSLFLLSRYREVLFSGSDNKKSVVVMISSAGHTIIISGVTLAGTFMGLAILPLDMLRTLGLGSAISILTTLAVNITLTPSLLLTFNNFFSRCVEPFVCGKWRLNFGARLAEAKPLIDYTERSKKGQTFWYRLGRLTTTFPWNILLIVGIVGLTIPFDMHSLHYKTSDSFSIALPRHYEVTKAYNLMCEQFGYGTVYPYVLFMHAPGNETVMSEEFFTYSQSIVYELAKIPNTNLDNFFSVTYGMGKNITLEEYNLCKAFDFSVLDCPSLKYAADTLINPNKTAMLIYVTLSWDPLAQDGFAWLSAAREVLEKNAKITNCTYYFTGMVSDSLDSVDYVYSAFPIMGAVTVAVVLVFVGISFRSVFVPLRSILTIMLTLAFVYGFATLIYQYNILKWMHFEGFIALGALSWIPPLVSFSIIVGIGLDYDIFLLTRVQEYREDGEYSTNDAIMKGVNKTGGIITAAGVIMAIAFSGLLFSDISVMNQLAVYLVFSVLFDTFVVRSLLVPSLMGLLRDVNWWPKKMPEPSKSLWFH